ncbi:hypothetical protein SAMN05216464_112106 [Mucilaginibacter pineti]|uniref:Uncharacterized protein n=1 Tax=Mucilaginibacter pineti TaxID=1391627 RepID=A0A1G7I0P5_9SPHI|nr:hypothetical protein [Mucilaginibacter pineti]SDF06320.1 hypothetical protein SAMN05216464_112106 [Mucilaginibacter pineti]
MKLPILKALFCVAVLLFTLKTQAQDYIITMKGDSIPCKTNRALGGVKFRYQTSEMKSNKTIKPTEIKEFKNSEENVILRSVVIKGEDNPKFLALVERGTISLYYVLGRRHVNHYGFLNVTDAIDELYVSKGSDTVTLLKSNLVTELTRDQLRHNFAKLLIDKKSLYDRFLANDGYATFYLYKIVHFYNTGLLLNPND